MFQFVAGNVATLAVVIYLYKTYTNRVPFYVTAVTLVGMFFSFSVVVSLPIDIVHKMPQLLGYWKVLYWTMFNLTWFIIPFLTSFCRSGEFTFKKKCIGSVKENLLYYGILVLLGIGLFIYLLLKKFSVDSIVSYSITVATGYGLVLLICFMGYGLVEVPRDVWNFSNYSLQLRHSEVYALRLKDKMAETKENLDRIERQLKKIHTGPNAFEMQERTLVKLNSEMTKYTFRRERLEHEYRINEQKAFKYQDILQTRKSIERRFQSTLLEYSGFVSQFLWYWYQIEPWLYKFVSILLTASSLIIIWSQLFVYFDLSVLTLSKSPIIILLVLMYMSVCTFSSLVKVKIFEKYRLVKGHTESPSLLFFTGYFCKLSIPLCYDFLLLSKEQDSMFAQVMKQMDLIGQKFSLYVPIAIILVCCVTFFKPYKFLEDDFQDYENARELIRLSRAEAEMKQSSSNENLI